MKIKEMKSKVGQRSVNWKQLNNNIDHAVFTCLCTSAKYFAIIPVF